MLGEAAEVKLEGRIVPVVRTRAAGISQLASLAEKVQRWADVADVRVQPLLGCLDRLSGEDPEMIAADVLKFDPQQVVMHAEPV